MHQELVRELEDEIETAIAEVMARLKKKLPTKPQGHTLHAMAKAAVTVYEAVAEAE